MTLTGITRKLIRKNRSPYVLYGLSIAFAISMLGAYGVLLFSPLITQTLMTDGSTYIISLGMFGLTFIGTIVFLFYANMIYVQYQMEDAGIFLSLGMNPKAVSEIQRNQLDSVFFIGGLFGLLLSVPISFGLWSFLTLFLSYTEHRFTIGWIGLLIACGLWIFLWILFHFKNVNQILKLDIIKVLRSSTKREEVKYRNPIFLVFAIIGIPLCLVLFKGISIFFLVLILLVIYLLTAQITTIGGVIKKIFPSYYRKNILYYNLIRQKGNQYTLALLISSLLVGLTIFCICFNAVNFIELYYQIKEEPYDYAILAKEEQKNLNKKSLQEMAKKHNILINEWNCLDTILLAREHQYTDKNKNEWSYEFFIGVSTFNKFAGTNLSVAEDAYIFYQDSDNSAFQTFSEPYGMFYNPTTKKDFTLKKQELLTKSKLLNKSTGMDRFIIVSNKTYDGIARNLESAYKLNYYLLKAEKSDQSRDFQNEILEKLVSYNKGYIDIYCLELPARDKSDTLKKEVIPYKDNELYTARWWGFYPYSRQTQMEIRMESGAVYFLLIFFISMISFVSSAMIMGLKIIETNRQDQENYKRAIYLGMKENDLKKLIYKQVRFIYFFPTICGGITASFIFNCFIAETSVTHVNEVAIFVVLVSILVLILQVIIFIFILSGSRKSSLMACH